MNLKQLLFYNFRSTKNKNHIIMSDCFRIAFEIYFVLIASAKPALFRINKTFGCAKSLLLARQDSENLVHFF